MGSTASSEEAKSVDRRNFLKYIGGAIVLIAAAGAGYYFYTAQPPAEKPPEEKPPEEKPPEEKPPEEKPPHPLAGKVISILVPYKPGGGYDLMCRIMATFLPNFLPEITTVVVNKPGAGGLVMAKELYASKPDGTTIGLLDAFPVEAARWLGEIDFGLRDLTLLARITYENMLIITNVNSPFKTIEDLKKAGRPLRIGTSGLIDNDYLSSRVALEEILGIPLDYITEYEGSADANASLLRGELDLTCFSLATQLSVVEAGQARPLLVVARERIQELPDVPALGEFTPPEKMDLIEGLEAVIQIERILAAPPNLPDDVFDTLSGALSKMFEDKGFKKAFRRATGRQLRIAGPEETVKLIEAVRVVEPLARKYWGS
jgi:tripartite-type tricarboxylate transporter receptor subunit TctC